MARVFNILGLLIICHFIGVKSTYINHECSSTYNGTAADLEKRDYGLPGAFVDVYYQAQNVKFNITTYDDNPNKVYLLFQCREDLSFSDCASCVYDGQRTLLTGCSRYNEAVVWHEECMFRYAHRNFFSSFETLPSHREWSMENVSNIDDFAPVLAKTMDGIIKEAVTDGNHFAASEMNFTLSKKVYCLAQCTGDLDGSLCQKCLDFALAQITDCCNASVWAGVFLTSCQLRYDNKPILVRAEEWAAPSPSPSMLPPADQDQKGPSTSNEETSLKPGVIIAISSAASFGFVLLVTCLWLCLCRTKPGESFEKMSGASQITDGFQDGTMEDISSLESLQVDFTVVKAATGNFAEENKLGQGGFGEVYKGKFSNGEEVAVKRLSKNSQQGSIEFKNEVLLLAKLQHRNLVKLQGFCLFREEKILIYEFLTNSSLDHFLYNELKRKSLDWELRFKIINGIARGLLYLHEDSRLRIIHRDLKVSNILLDDTMNAKIADFGLAKLFNLDQTQGDTMRIAGTYGYMAPEYALAGQFSVKSDVYSFRVILLEIVTGQRNSFFQRQSDKGLIHRAWRLWKEDATLELVDPLLGNNYSEEEAKLCIQIGLLCIQEDAAHRPRMASVVAAFSGQAITLPLPNAPHFYAIGALTNALSNNYDSSLGSEVHVNPRIDYNMF